MNKKMNFILALILILLSDIFIFLNFIQSNATGMDIVWLLLFQGFFVMLFSIIKILLLSENELDEPDSEYSKSHLGWALQVIAPFNIAIISNIFTFGFGLILAIIVIFAFLQGFQINQAIINTTFIFPSILALIAVEIGYFIVFLFSEKRSSKKIVDLSNKFTLPLALVFGIGFLLVGLKITFIVSLPGLFLLIFLFKLGVDFYYSSALLKD